MFFGIKAPIIPNEHLHVIVDKSSDAPQHSLNWLHQVLPKIVSSAHAAGREATYSEFNRLGSLLNTKAVINTELP